MSWIRASVNFFPVILSWQAITTVETGVQVITDE